MPGEATSAWSLPPIAIDPVPSPIVAFVGLLRPSVKASAGSGGPSSVIGTTTVFVVSPGAKVSVPVRREVGVALALPSAVA